MAIAENRQKGNFSHNPECNPQRLNRSRLIQKTQSRTLDLLAHHLNFNTTAQLGICVVVEYLEAKRAL